MPVIGYLSSSSPDALSSVMAAFHPGNAIAHHAADADPAVLSQPLQPRGHVYPIAEDVVLFNDHVAQIPSTVERWCARSL